jgi:alkane 1-monooxygenase
MLKYLQYYISSVTFLVGLYFINNGQYYPTVFLIAFSLFIILGDHFLAKDKSIYTFEYPFFLNLPIYLNTIFLFFFTFNVVWIFSNNQIIWFSDFLDSILMSDVIYRKSTLNTLDKASLIMILSLFIGIMGTVPGHELIHRKKNKFDQFIGKLLLSLSWDCTFAIEHVHGHHKNVGYENDPATAKRNQSVYRFVLNAIIKEHSDAWNIELKELKRRDLGLLTFKNNMIMGYIRSLSLTIIIYVFGGLFSLTCFIMCSFIAKAFLEVINFTEHYGLVREKGKPVEKRHSWNSNSKVSSLYLYNVTRHSSHHEKVSLKYWELDPYSNKAPMLPFGYLSMLYLAIFLPKLYHKTMRNQLKYWDDNFATIEEQKIIKVQLNKNIY